MSSASAMTIEEPKPPMSNKKKLMFAGAGVAVVVVLALVITLPIVLTSSDDDDEPSEAVLQRIDCFPEAAGGVEVADQASCEARGCVWSPDSSREDSPSCYVPQDANFGFRVVGERATTPMGFQYMLEPINSRAIYDDNFKQVSFDVEFHRDHLLRFKVKNTNFQNLLILDVQILLASVCSLMFRTKQIASVWKKSSRSTWKQPRRALLCTTSTFTRTNRSPSAWSACRLAQSCKSLTLPYFKEV